MGRAALPTTARTFLPKPAWKCRSNRATNRSASLPRNLHDPEHGVYGICLRGEPGWGQNMAYISTLVNTFGGRWLDLDWKPQLTSPAWVEAVSFYVDLLSNYGPPGAITDGYNENRALFANGNCAMWVDATSAASYFLDPSQSRVATTTGFAKAPIAKVPNGAAWVWSWALAIPTSSKRSRRWPSSSSSGPPAGAISPRWASVSAGCGFLRARGNPPTKFPHTCKPLPLRLWFARPF